MELLRALASWVTTGVVTLGAAAGIVLSNIGPSPSTPIAQAPIAQAPIASPSRVASTPHVAHRTSNAASWPSNAPSIHVAALSVKWTTPGAPPVVAETPSTTVPMETTTSVLATVPTTQPPTTQPPTTQPPSFVAPVVVSTPPPVVITTTTVPQHDGGGSDD
jgi:hypothetical protein